MQIDEDSLQTRSCIPGLRNTSLAYSHAGDHKFSLEKQTCPSPAPLTKYLRIQPLEGVSVKHPGSQMVTLQ